MWTPSATAASTATTKKTIAIDGKPRKVTSVSTRIIIAAPMIVAAMISPRVSRLAMRRAGHGGGQTDNEEANMAGMLRKLMVSGVAAKVIQEIIDNDLNSKLSFADYAAVQRNYDNGGTATRQISTWQMSGMVILMTLIGGMGTFTGPVLGAFIVVMLENKVGEFGRFLANATGVQWFQILGESVTIVIGLIFIICVMAFRRGIVGELVHWRKTRKA